MVSLNKLLTCICVAEDALIHGETFIHNWLTSNKFEFASQYELNLPESIVRIDFWVTYKNEIYAIEYNGRQQRDTALQDYCNSNKIKLLWVKYDLTFNQVESELRSFFGVEG